MKCVCDCAGQCQHTHACVLRMNLTLCTRLWVNIVILSKSIADQFYRLEFYLWHFDSNELWFLLTQLAHHFFQCVVESHVGGRLSPSTTRLNSIFCLYRCRRWANFVSYLVNCVRVCANSIFRWTELCASDHFLFHLAMLILVFCCWTLGWRNAMHAFCSAIKPKLIYDKLPMESLFIYSCRSDSEWRMGQNRNIRKNTDLFIRKKT